MAGALEGIRILDWTMYQHGSATGYMLGDLGAEVIHIEQPVVGDAYRGVQSLWGAGMSVTGPQGQTVSVAFEAANRNKKSVVLDLSKPRGQEVLYRMVERSDVFLTNFRKSVARRLKVDYETLSGYNPRIIYANATTYGSKGPDGERRGFDPLGQARSGIMFQLGDRDQEEPLQATGGISDQLGATMVAYAILAALVTRERQGIGQEVEASLVGSMIHQQGLNVDVMLWRGHPQARHSRKRARNPLSNMYQCGDGRWLALAELQSDRFWPQFCEALGHPELATDPRFENAINRRENCEEFIPILDQIFASRPRGEWMELLKATGMAVDVIHNLNDLAQDPQVLANEHIIEMDHEILGRIKAVGFPISMSKTPPAVQRRAPEFGEHTEEVLLGAGYSWEEIAQLREQGVI